MRPQSERTYQQFRNQFFGADVAPPPFTAEQAQALRPRVLAAHVAWQASQQRDADPVVAALHHVSAQREVDKPGLTREAALDQVLAELQAVE